MSQCSMGKEMQRCLLSMCEHPNPAIIIGSLLAAVDLDESRILTLQSDGELFHKHFRRLKVEASGRIPAIESVVAL